MTGTHEEGRLFQLPRNGSSLPELPQKGKHDSRTQTGGPIYGNHPALKNSLDDKDALIASLMDRIEAMEQTQKTREDF
jgi:hypothetical protein